MKHFSSKNTDLGSLIGSFNCGYHTLWKGIFSATLIFREINFGLILREINLADFRISKTAILTISPAALVFEFLAIFDTFECVIYQRSKFRAFKIVQIGAFDLLKSAKIDFT